MLVLWQTKTVLEETNDDIVHCITVDTCNVSVVSEVLDISYDELQMASCSSTVNQCERITPTKQMLLPKEKLTAKKKPKKKVDNNKLSF